MLTFCRQDNEVLLVFGRHLELTLLTRNAISAQYCPGQGRMKHLYDKNRLAQAGILVAETGIPAWRDGTKNVPLPYKQYVIKNIETYTCRDLGHRLVPVIFPSRLSNKQALKLYDPASHANIILCS